MYKQLKELRDLLKMLQVLSLSGTCDTGMAGSTTVIVCAQLANFEADRFNTGYSMVVLRNANSVGNAPEGQFRDITDYVAATGTFTTAAFGANVEEGDLVAVMKNELADWADGGRLDLILDAILADTNEVQVSLANGGFTDLLIDSIITGLIGGTAAVNRVAGKPQVFPTTIDLHQAAGTYDVATATTQNVVIDSIVFVSRLDISDDVAGITAVTIQTDTTTEQEFMDNADGAIVNLTAEAQYGWDGSVLLKATDKIQFTIEGGTATADPSTCDVVITYHAVVNGGYLA